MGIAFSIYGQSFPPKSKFVPERDIPDLTGKVIIVTGGNTGIGFHTVEELLKKNAKVYLAARSQSKAEDAIQRLKNITGKEAIYLNLDLGDLDAVSRSAKEFKSRESELHILFNSAGVMQPPLELLTANGYDLQFGTNVLGPAHFTLCLLPELIAGAQSSPDGKARVIHTSSLAIYFAVKGGIRWDTLRDGEARNEMGKKDRASELYYQSKLGNAIFANELARRYSDRGIVSNSVNPGNLETELTRNWDLDARLQDRVFRMLLWPAPYGALTQLWAGTSPETKDYNGKFFIPWARVGEATADAKDPEAGTKLWEWIEEQRKPHI